MGFDFDRLVPASVRTEGHEAVRRARVLVAANVLVTCVAGYIAWLFVLIALQVIRVDGGSREARAGAQLPWRSGCLPQRWLIVRQERSHAVTGALSRVVRPQPGRRGAQ